MERYSDRAIEIINELHTERLNYESEYLPLIECANQCKAYEDTGLEPEEIRSLRIDMAIIKAMFGDADVKRMKELCEADKEGQVVVLEDVTAHQANTIMGMCEQLNAMKARHGDDQEPLITWQLYNALVKSFARAEAEAAIGGVQT